jgi:hypothetical protein
MKDLRHAHGHRGFAGAGIAGEAHVQAGRDRARGRRQPEVGAQLVDHQQCRDVADAALDRRQADEVAFRARR